MNISFDFAKTTGKIRAMHAVGQPPRLGISSDYMHYLKEDVYKRQIRALNSAGYNLGGDSVTIPVFGVDATDAAKDLIANGKMTGTIRQDAESMAKAITLLTENALSNGEKSLMDSTENYNVDDSVNKIRISYAKYLGE